MYTRFCSIFWFCRSEEDSEGNRDICSEMLQMKALERLTSTVRVANFGQQLLDYQLILKSIYGKFDHRFICSKRYKVSWRQLSPERLAKHVSVRVVGFPNASEEMLLGLNLFIFSFCFFRFLCSIGAGL